MTACTLLGPFMVKLVGFALPERSPLQWSKAQFAEACAVRVTTLLLMYGPVGGLAVMLPLPPTADSLQARYPPQRFC
jgi:hypothetical protein